MKPVRVLSVVLISCSVLFCVLCSDDHSEISCSDFKNSIVGYLLYQFRSKKNVDFSVSFWLATNEVRKPIILKPRELSKSSFSPWKKTYLIIHGYHSGTNRQWVADLKDGILDNEEANVILVDWSSGSNNLNYVNSVQSTQEVSHQILKFLQSLAIETVILSESSNNFGWNHLHFLGHSLGAHISGQVGHLLKNDKFWHVERITGFDPANPCFKYADMSLKLDSGDAAFVDVIHTQSNLGGEYDLGLRQNIGHIDFWINGGLEQLKCFDAGLNTDIEMKICAHKASYQYFIESMKMMSYGECSYKSFPWDGTYKDAKHALNVAKEGDSCYQCPKLGLDLKKSAQNGSFLVFAGSKSPYCTPTGEDYEKLDLLIEKFKLEELDPKSRREAEKVLKAKIAYHSPKRKNQPVDWNGNSQFYDFAEDALTMDNIK